jgi:subtilisin family serine protease
MERFRFVLRSRGMVLGIALAIALLSAFAPSQAATSIHGRSGDFVPGEVLVKFRDTQSRAQSISRQSGQELDELDRAGLTRVKIRDEQAVEEAIAAYGQDANVEYAQPNYIYTLQSVPNDSLFGQLWGLQNTGQTVVKGQAPSDPDPTHNPGTAGMDMNLVPAWDLITDCSSVIVGVVDSGLTYNHEDLAANLWSDPAYPNHGYDFVGNTYDPVDLNGHGTHVSGTIGAVGNNGRGTSGVCWKAKLMALRACNTIGECTTASEVSALNFAVRNNAKVINMSLGGPSMDQALSDAILSASNSDVVVVVAAGNNRANNDNASTPTYPCNFRLPNIICVAALDQAYALASFSNFGATTVHVGAPGVNVVSTWAGAQTKITDNFHTGTMLNWTATTTTTGGWAYGQRMVSGQAVDVLLDPSTFPTTGTYHANTDDRVYKRFDLTPARAAVLDFVTQYTLAPFDFLNVNFRAAGGDPFATGEIPVLQLSGSTSGLIAVPELDISQCIEPNCTVGFQLRSGNNPPDVGGVGILGFQITTLQLNNVTYNILEGTSMATPHVTGLAAMLRAYNPSYTVADVVSAIKNGGTSVAALVGKTSSGKAVNALGSLSYINAPIGVAATIMH